MYNPSFDTTRWYHMVNTLGAIKDPFFMKGATPSNYVERYLLNRAVPVNTQFYDAKPKDEAPRFKGFEAPYNWLKSPEYNSAIKSVVFPSKFV